MIRIQGIGGWDLDQYTETDFYEILKSIERTTDMLEKLAHDKLQVRVLKQENLVDRFLANDPLAREAPCSIMRESYLYSTKHNLITSHNFAIIYPELLPGTLEDEIYLKGRGIGEVIRTYEMQSKRMLIQYGFRDPHTLWDILYQDASLSFPINGLGAVPFKEYTIQFPGFSSYGIKILEYFNPRVLELGAKAAQPQ